MSCLDEWNGLMKGQRTNGAELVLEATVRRSNRGETCPFLGRASDGNLYWVKPLNNPASDRIPVTEQIVSRMGSLIGAPVCEGRTIEIPTAFSSYVYCTSRALVPGIAHASRAVVSADDVMELEHRKDDDNSKRHAFIFALFDWCWGDDDQWLVDMSDDYRCYSHDHGWYLPPEGPAWTKNDLVANLDIPRPLSGTIKGVDRAAIKNAASALRSVTRSQIVDALSKTPNQWPVSDEELEVVGCFLEHRAPMVARRLENRFQIPT